MNISEQLFYGGIITMCAAGGVAVVSTIILFITGGRLKKKLNEEYGEMRHT